MKHLKEILASQMNTFYRFQLFIREDGGKGKKSVGMAYLQENHSIYTVRIWTLLSEKFFLVPNKEDATRYFVMTREPNKSPGAKNKYFWNIVGNAKANAPQNELEIYMDLFEKKIYLSMYPEVSPTPKGLTTPEVNDLAA